MQVKETYQQCKIFIENLKSSITFLEYAYAYILSKYLSSKLCEFLNVFNNYLIPIDIA